MCSFFSPCLLLSCLPVPSAVWQLMSEAYPSVALFLEEKLLKMDQAFRYMTMPDPSIRANLGYGAQPSGMLTSIACSWHPPEMATKRLRESSV